MDTLSKLTESWFASKEEEKKAIEKRKGIEKLIREILPQKTEGTVSEVVDNQKITVTYKVNRKVDTDSLRENWHTLSPESQAVFKWKADLSLTAFKKIEDISEIQTFITTSEASPYLTIKEIK